MEAMSAQSGKYQRSASGMIGAMLVLLLTLAAFWVLREINRTTPDTPVRTVDYKQAADFARGRASFDVLAPASLPPGWRATSATYTPEPGESWHLGLLTGEGRYVGLEQSPSSEESMVETYVDEEATRGGLADIDGQSWTAWSDDTGDDALVRREGDVTTLVVGTAGQDVLIALVDRLGEPPG